MVRTIILTATLINFMPLISAMEQQNKKSIELPRGLSVHIFPSLNQQSQAGSLTISPCALRNSNGSILIENKIPANISCPKNILQALYEIKKDHGIDLKEEVWSTLADVASSFKLFFREEYFSPIKKVLNEMRLDQKRLEEVNSEEKAQSFCNDTYTTLCINHPMEKCVNDQIDYRPSLNSLRCRIVQSAPTELARTVILGKVNNDWGTALKLSLQLFAATGEDYYDFVYPLNKQYKDRTGHCIVS